MRCNQRIRFADQETVAKKGIGKGGAGRHKVGIRGFICRNLAVSYKTMGVEPIES